MTHFAHISPTAYLDTFCRDQTHHLLLAHLLEKDQAYREWYQNKRITHPYDVYIMDNSAFELYKEGRPMFDSFKLIDLAKTVRANYVVMSDYPGRPCIETIAKAQILAPILKDNGFKTFFCPQSQVGDLDDLVYGYKWALDNQDKIDYVAFSILNVPNGYGVEKNNRLQRFLARWSFFLKLHELGIMQQLESSDIKVHMLGMVDGPQELALIFNTFTVDMIDTWDSSAAVWAGLNNIRFDQSPTGLVNGKFELAVDFDHKTADSNQIRLADYNIAFIESIIKNVQLYDNQLKKEWVKHLLPQMTISCEGINGRFKVERD